jgi:hypothetical protein
MTSKPDVINYKYPAPSTDPSLNPSVPVQDATTPGIQNIKSKVWPFNKQLRVVFLNGTANQKAKVQSAAEEWTQGIPIFSFNWVNGVHGDVRVAFDDPTTNEFGEGDPILRASWSQVGTDSLNPSVFPETTHLSQIEDTDPKKITEHERIIIQHEFGHVLGLQFAPNRADLQKWRDEVKWKDFMNQVNKDTKERLQSSFGNPISNPPASIWAKDLTNPYLQPDLDSDSVMVFDWRNRISEGDLICIGNLYPTPIRAITFGVQDAFDRSVKRYDDDLVLYAITTVNTIIRNTRVAKKDGTTTKSTWKGWKVLNKRVPLPLDLNARSFVALDFPDRLEFFVATQPDKDKDPKKTDPKFATLYYNRQLKDTGKWGSWEKVKHGSNDLQLFNTYHGWKDNLHLEPATILRAVEVDGGANVFFITDKQVLGTIFRKSGELPVPTNFHPVSGGTKVVAITSARIGAPTITNPPRIVASTTKDISITAPNKSTQNWDLKSEGTVGDETLEVYRLATGMAIDTQHILAIDGTGRLRQNLNKDGWLSWDDSQMKVPTGKDFGFVSISAGVIASSDSEDGYLRTFAVCNCGKLWTSKVNDEGVYEEWAKIDTTLKKGVPSNIKRVTTKRTRSGDLEVFIFAQDPDDSNRDLLYNITYDSNGLSPGSAKYGFRRVWWNPRSFEAYFDKN